MSRIVQIPIGVECDADGQPVSLVIEHKLPLYPVLHHLAHWREWIGVLDGEPQRDVWKIEIERGVCEIHYLSFPKDGESESDPALGERISEWVLARWED